MVTYCDKNFEWNLLNDFILTLYNEGRYDGDLIVIDYGLNKEVVDIIEEKYSKVKIIKKEQNKSVHSECHKHFSEILTEHKEYTHAMVIDAGDVWFQKQFDEIFSICDDYIGYTIESEICTEKWTLTKIMDIENVKLKKDILSCLYEKKLISGGMFIGPSRKLINMFNEIYQHINLINQDYFGVDMVASNYVIRRNIANGATFIELPITYDYAVITNKYQSFYEGRLILDKYKNKVKIAHNCGGSNRLIDRKMDFNERYIK